MVDVRAASPLEAIRPEPVFPEDEDELARWQVKAKKVELTGVCPACQARLERAS